jgi:hypothetical protein
MQSPTVENVISSGIFKSNRINWLYFIAMKQEGIIRQLKA